MCLKLCLITKPNCCQIPNYLTFIEQAIIGGITSVQFREKISSPAEKYNFALSLQLLLSKYKIPLLINDDLDLTVKLNADGIHLGQSDILPQKARDQLGPNKYIGLSIETLTQLKAANELDCINYVAASAVFPSSSKSDCKTIWGLEGLKKIIKLSKYPVVAIGGITLDNLQSVVIEGVAGVAVINSLHNDNPAYLVKKFIQKINQGTYYDV